MSSCSALSLFVFFYFNFFFHILVLLTLIINGAEYQSVSHIHFTDILRKYVPKTVTYSEGKTGDPFSRTKGVFLFQFFKKVTATKSRDRYSRTRN